MRPKNKTAMSKEDFCLFVARMGSKTRAAEALGVPRSKIGKYMRGEAHVTQLFAERAFAASYREASGTEPLCAPVQQVGRFSIRGLMPVCVQRHFMSHGCLDRGLSGGTGTPV